MLARLTPQRSPEAQEFEGTVESDRSARQKATNQVRTATHRSCECNCLIATAIGRYDVPVDRYQTLLLIALLPFYFATYGLYQFTVSAVNRQLVASERIPHSLFWRGWNLVRDNYKRFYPRSSIYQLSMVCAVTVAMIALAFVALSLWEYTYRLR
jgi:hypothetical protein